MKHPQKDCVACVATGVLKLLWQDEYEVCHVCHGFGVVSGFTSGSGTTLSFKKMEPKFIPKTVIEIDTVIAQKMAQDMAIKMEEAIVGKYALEDWAAEELEENEEYTVTLDGIPGDINLEDALYVNGVEKKILKVEGNVVHIQGTEKPDWNVYQFSNGHGVTIKNSVPKEYTVKGINGDTIKVI